MKRCVAPESKREEVLPILLCYTVPLYSQKRRREGARTKAFHHRNPARTRLKDPAGIILAM